MLVNPTPPASNSLISSGSISRAQGYKLLKQAWAQFKEDVDESGIDRRTTVFIDAELREAEAEPAKLEG